MDYDRALYRVYERIMEELNASPSPLALASSDRHEIHHRNVRSGGGRRDNMDMQGFASTGATATGGVSEGDGDGDDQQLGSSSYNDVGDSNEGAADRPTSVRIPPSIASRRRVLYSTVRMQQRHRRQQQQHQPLPFLFPIWMSRKIDQIMEHNRLHHHPMLNDTNHSSTFYVAYLWSKIQGWMDLIGNLGGQRHTTYTSVASSAPILNNSSSSIMSATPTSITNINLQVADEEMGEIQSGSSPQEVPNPPPLSSNGDQSPSSSSPPGSDGLRRRSNSRQVSGGGLQQQNNDDITLLSSIANRREGGSSDVPPLSMSHPSMSSQRRGEQDEHSVSHYQRREGGGTSGRSSSSSSSNSSSTSNSSEYHLRSNDGTTTSSSNESTSSSSSDDSINARNSQLDDDNNGPIDRVGSINDHNYDERGGCSQLNVYIAMRLSFAIAVFHIFVLISLHSTYVGPYAFRGRHINMKQQYGHVSRKQRRQQDETTATDSTFVNCIAYALSTRPIKDRSSYFGGRDEDVPSDGNDTVERLLSYETGTDLAEHEWPNNSWESFERTPSFRRGMAGIENATSSDTMTTEDEFHPLLGKDEILQIKILYGNSCVGQCSRVRTVDYPVQLYPNSSDNYTDGDTPGFQARMLTQVDRLLNASQIDHNTTSEDELSSPSYWEKVHYRFGLDDALLHLDETSSFLHNITLVNVTVTERCLSSGSDNGDLSALNTIGEFLSQIYGMDSIIINQLMYGIRGADGAFTSGYVKSMETQERWGWHKELLDAFENKAFMHVAETKLGILSMSILAFFLVTSVTSLIVRVLTSSGVVLMFPMFTLLRSLGLPGANERVISLSYPWIGAARAAVSAERSHPQGHLVCAHVTKVLLYYVMYEGCQAAWSVVLYAKSVPEALPVCIFGFAMIWEYYSMVFVRSALAIHFFPRVALLYFICYHIYFYSVPYGFFDVALIPLFFFMIHAMLFTIVGLEVPKSARGVLSVACPREVYNRLSWQEPSAAIPQEWTIFLPVNARLNPLHDREISSGG